MSFESKGREGRVRERTGFLADLVGAKMTASIPLWRKLRSSLPALAGPASGGDHGEFLQTAPQLPRRQDWQEFTHCHSEPGTYL